MKQTYTQAEVDVMQAEFYKQLSLAQDQRDSALRRLDEWRLTEWQKRFFKPGHHVIDCIEQPRGPHEIR